MLNRLSGCVICGGQGQRGLGKSEHLKLRSQQVTLKHATVRDHVGWDIPARMCGRSRDGNG